MKLIFSKFGIHNKKNLKNLAKQFILFGIVGLSNTLVSFSIYYLILLIKEDLYLLGGALGWTVSVFNAFFWGNKLVFKSTKGNFLKKLLKSYISYGASFLLSLVFLYVQVEWLSISKIVAPILNMIITLPLNFILNKFWTFKE